MKILGNQKSLLVTIIVLLLQLLSTSIVAKTADEEKWDKDFFQNRCPGFPVDQKEQVDNITTTDITADDINKPETGTVSFTGNVELTQGLKRISALIGQLNEKSNQFSAQGNVRYEDQYIRLTTKAIDLDFSEQGGSVGNVKFQLANGALRGEAESIRLSDKTPLEITKVGFTSCPPGNSSWLLQSSDVTLDAESGWGDADNVVLWIGDIPVFYLPTISFPIDERRKSGFLYPSVGNSSRNGIELGIPWYWNIAPDKDATFSTRYLSERGLMLGAEYRHLTEHTESELFTEYLANDKKGPDNQKDRYFFKLNTDYASGDHWRGNFIIRSLSDDDYFYDFGSNAYSGNRNILRRSGQIRFDNEQLSFSGMVSDDRLLSSAVKSYSRLPQLRLSLLYPEASFGLEPKIQMEATAFRHADHYLGAVEAERLIFAPELSMPVHWYSGYIKPSLKLHYSYYSQDDPDKILPDTANRFLPIFSIDSGLFFERTMEFNNQSFIQTLEPRLFYLYVPKKEQESIALFDTISINNGVDSLFRENRYSGSDRIGDSNQLSFAISTGFNELESGRERLRITAGRAYYLEDRDVNLAIYQGSEPAVDLGVDRSSHSALITNVQLSLVDNWWFEGELAYDESTSRTDKGVFGLQYRSSALLLNLRHRLNRYEGSDDIEQAEMSISWPINDKFSFIGRWQKDIQNNRTIDNFAGLEYESCCWALRLVARRYLNVRLDNQGTPVSGIGKYNDGIYLEFILKGLTNIGRRLNLETDIQGYEDRFSY